MGMTASARIFYGIAFTDDDELPDDLGDRAYGHEREERNRAVPLPGEFDLERERADPEFAAVWDRWREQRREFEKGQAQLGHRGYEFSHYHVAIKGSELSVSWTETAEVNVLHLMKADEEWNEKLRAYCAALGLPWREPKWLLAASYG